LRSVLVRGALSLALLIIPSILATTLLSNKDLGPLISLSYILAIAVAGWFFGLAAGLFVAAASIVSLTVVVSGGKLFLPPHFDYAGIVGLIFIAVLSSRVAAYRNKVEKVLRSANEELERRVRERTSDLERAREWFQITLGSIGDAVIATDTAGRITLLNGVAQAITGWPQDDAAGLPLEQVFRIVNEETRAEVESPVTKVLRLGTVVGLANHTMLLARDGREIPIDDSAAPIRTPGGELVGVVLIFRDIAERYKAERERERFLAETAAARAEAEFERAHLQSLFLQAPVAIDIIRGPSHIYEFAHPLTRERLGRDVTGLTVRDALGSAEDRGIIKILDEVYSSGMPYNGKAVPVQYPGSAGSIEDRYFDLTITPWRESDSAIAGIIAMAADVTEQVLNRRAMEAAEERLRETAKLESLGVLAGGIAHDFNNLLVGILGNASLAQEMLPPGSPISELLGDVVNASDKAALLTRQMLAYSGRGKFVVEPVDISTMVREILPLVSRSISPAVSVDLSLASNLPPIECDKAQMQQVIMNLLINAAESCGSQAGMVHVSTSTSAGDARTLGPAFGLPPVQAGAFVRLEVRDTGCGMTEEVKAKIFDPFFTTKFTGRGLGLSAALGIIRAHRGAIQVESAAGKGATFRVYFPAAAGVAESATNARAQRQQYAGGGTILVVDDEEVVRRTASVTLQRYGYRVLTADNGQAAVQLFESMAREIVLVILDLTMPVMGGEAALEHLKRIDPAAKILLSSGFSSAEVTERFQGRGLTGFLQKPYAASKLADEVQTVLGRHGTAQAS
jgi:two-component system cell cycle sensor histidine kinase/response regulator CckA